MNWTKFLSKVALWLVMVPVDFIMVLTGKFTDKNGNVWGAN